MSGLGQWASATLLGSSMLMLFVIVLRVPVRQAIGPRLGYVLWALPALRMIVPPLPADLFSPAAADIGAQLSVLVVGPPGSGLLHNSLGTHSPVDTMLFTLWLGGAAALLGSHVVRHLRFRRRLLASATMLGRHGAMRIVEAAVDGPLAFGVVHRFVAVPRDFADRYSARERQLVLAHELAHQSRGALAANWASLVLLALHWWNPLAWAAMRAFREDQEFAVDAHVLGQHGPDARPAYACVLAKAAGVGVLPASNLNPRSNLKGRLKMLAQNDLPKRRLIACGSALMLLGVAALAATVSLTSAAGPKGGRQAVTIGIKPDGTGSYALIVGGASVAPGAPLPGGATLPSDFSAHGGCDLKPSAEPLAMVLKGIGGDITYTVMCASAKPAPVGATLTEGLASLKTMRGSVAAQHTPNFPEAERRHALGAIDRSIREVEATLAVTR